MDQLAFAGQRYRAVLEVSPNDAAAKKAQSDLMTMAMATFSSHKNLGAVASDGNKTLQIVVVAVLTIAFAVGAIWFLPKLLPPADGGARMDESATGRGR
jgi:membrane glycosyltransferase